MLKEFLKRIEAKLNATPAIKLVVWLVGILATSFGTGVRAIFCRLKLTRSSAMMEISGNCGIVIETAATLRVGIPERASADNCLFPAITLADPRRASLHESKVANDGQSPESLADHINALIGTNPFHKWGYILP